MTESEVVSAYEDLYPGRLDDEALERHVPSALAYVSLITARRADKATGWKKERAIQAVCAVVNEMAAQDAALSEGGARLASVSNDGYTEHYGQAGSDGQSALRRAAMQWLSGTGLAGAL